MYIFSFIPYREGVKIFNDIFPLEPKFFFFFYLDLCISKNLRKKNNFFLQKYAVREGGGAQNVTTFICFFLRLPSIVIQIYKCIILVSC